MTLEDLLFLKFVPWRIVLIAKGLFIASFLFSLGLLLFLIKNTSYAKYRFIFDFRQFFSYRPQAGEKITKNWFKLAGRLELGLESEYKLAVIEADTLLDEALKRMGYPGETLGERLKQLTPAVCPNISAVLEAHRTRNDIIHDPDYRLSLEQARKVVGVYEEAFRSFEML